ncbi:MAG: aquaporin [Planctomycetota bacterium]
MRKYIAEMVGTFILVFAGTGAVVTNSVSHGAVTHPGIALVFGLVVMALIYAFGSISGAHFNPAVTLGFWAAKEFPLSEVPKYIASQLVGAFAASFVLLLLFGNVATLGATLPAGSEWQSFGLEIVLSGILMLVILCVSSGPKEIGAMAGLAIGGVIGLEAMFGGPICGASMNPARSLAPAIVSGHTASLWIYLTAPIIGSVSVVPLAALLFPKSAPDQ